MAAGEKVAMYDTHSMTCSYQPLPLVISVKIRRPVDSILKNAMKHILEIRQKRLPLEVTVKTTVKQTGLYVL